MQRIVYSVQIYDVAFSTHKWQSAYKWERHPVVQATSQYIPDRTNESKTTSEHADLVDILLTKWYIAGPHYYLFT